MGHYSPDCRACRIPLEGLRAIPPRVLRGVRRSPKNPHYCNLCGEKAIRGFLTTLTVLFADVRGFTPLTTEMGPLRTRQMLDDYHRMMGDILYDKDAFVDHIGDALMAYFQAHGYHGTENREFGIQDHVRRAVDSAFAMQRALEKLNQGWQLPRGIGMGIGISTGEAAVGAVGSADPAHYTAIGEVVNIASRLQTQAEAGEILVIDTVYRYVASTYPQAERRELQLKGLAVPVVAYNLTVGLTAAAQA